MSRLTKFIRQHRHNRAQKNADAHLSARHAKPKNINDITAELADELYLLGDCRAEQAYFQLTSRYPKTHDFRYRLASILLERGLIEEAEKVLSDGESIEGFPSYSASLLAAIREDKRLSKQHPPVLSKEQRLVVLDDSFPCDLSGFRYSEFTEILKAIPQSVVLSSTWDMSRFGKSVLFEETLDQYRKSYRDLAERVHRFTAEQNIEIDVAYSVFLNGATRLWRANPNFKTRRAVFTLYPGGGFDLNGRLSNEKLKRLCDDPRLTKIITTQRPTYDYLLEKGFCEKGRIEHIYGGVVPPILSQPSQLETPVPRQVSDVVNVCFVAHWYGTHRSAKGVDVFSDVVNRFSNDSRFAFHIVGEWSPELTGIRQSDNVFYYGVRSASFFPGFYSKMDAILSPALSLFEINNGVGPFDGFPTTACAEAGAAGVAMFLTDSLGMNTDICGRTIYKPHEEFEPIPRDADYVCDLLSHYLNNRDDLAALGQRGRLALLRELGFDKQVTPRIELLRQELRLAS